MGIFQEYLNSKGKTVEKPVVDISGDQCDPKTPPNAPPKGGKPYVGKSHKEGGKKGFGDMGDSDLEYKPATTKDNKGHAPAKIPTVEQMELANLVVQVLRKDPTVVETIVAQLKHQGMLGLLVAEMLQHRATYEHIAEIMNHENYGPSTCEALVRAMNKEVNEGVASPFVKAS